MRKGFWLWQCVAWTAVVMMAALVFWQDRIMSVEPRVYHAIRAVDVQFDQRARDQYFEQLKSFAREFGFALTFSQTSPDPNDIVAHLERDNIWMIGGLGSNLFGGPDLTYNFAFYSRRNQPLPNSLIDPVVGNLKRALGQIDRAVVTEKALQD